MTKEEAQLELVKLVANEVSTHEKGQFWVTDKVAFNMREMIKKFRKNYWGIYDQPKDKVTKKDKIWVPLTRTICDAVRKGVDRDPKDVRFRAKKSGIYSVTQLLRGYIREWMSSIYLNHAIDQLTTTISIDGTDVWKTYSMDGQIVRKDVDLLNSYIDPTSDSIQDAYRFTERALYTEADIKAMDGWENTSDFAVSDKLEKEDGNSSRKTGEYGDVYESWGLFPKNLIDTANGAEWDEEDDGEVEAQVVISGIDTDTKLYHFSKENDNKDKFGKAIKPYEECWYLKLPGCWYGVPPTWTLMGLQDWINMVVNLRINKNTIAQLGTLKIRKGSGVTQQMLSQLMANGVIELNDLADVDNMQVAESGESSYKDEAQAKQWAQEVTAIFDINLGELPASTSATGAAIQSQQSNTAFTLVVESIEHFMQRWFDRHVLPKMPAMIKKEGYVTLFKDFDDIKRIRERVVSHLAMERLEEMEKESGMLPSEQDILEELNRAQRQLEEDGDMFIEVLDEIIAEAVDTEVFMTNSEMDVGTVSRNLLALRQGMPPDAFMEMTAQALDLLGLEVPQSLRNPSSQQQVPGEELQPVGGGAIPDIDAELVTEANTVNNAQI